MSSKPSYEELEYQLAVTFAGYKDKCKEYEELEARLLAIQEGAYKHLQSSKAGINQTLNLILGHNDVEEQEH